MTSYASMVPQPKMLIVIAAYFVAVFIFAYLAKRKENRESTKTSLLPVKASALLY